MSYATLAQFKSHIRIDDGTDDTELQRSLDAASEQIDNVCGWGAGGFSPAASATTRRFHATSYERVLCGPIGSTAGLVVKTDDDDDGTAEITWVITTDYELEPANGHFRGVAGFPWFEVCAVGSRWFPRWRRPAVEITARWGWAAVPTSVVAAELQHAHKIHEARHTPDGFLATDAAIRAIGGLDGRTMDLLSHYRHPSKMIGIG